MTDATIERKDGLHCVLEKCVGPPFGPMCHPGCSFTMLTTKPTLLTPDVVAYLEMLQEAEVKPGDPRLETLVSGKEKAKQWWYGAVIPTGKYRLKANTLGGLHLQHLVTDTDGRRKRWFKIETVAAEASDDE